MFLAPLKLVKDRCQKFNIYMLSMKNFYLSINTKPAGISLNLPDLKNLIPIISPRMPAAPVYNKIFQKWWLIIYWNKPNKANGY